MSFVSACYPNQVPNQVHKVYQGIKPPASKFAELDNSPISLRTPDHSPGLRSPKMGPRLQPGAIFHFQRYFSVTSTYYAIVLHTQKRKEGIQKLAFLAPLVLDFLQGNAEVLCLANHWVFSLHSFCNENLRTKTFKVYTAITESLYTLSYLELPELSTTPTQSNPLCNLSLTKEKAHKTATKIHLHAAKTLTEIDNTKHAIHFSNSSNGGSGEGVVERAARRRARRTPGRMAENPPDPR
eukprot:1160637-Pelagomonas_calceolata.AAC.2